MDNEKIKEYKISVIIPVYNAEQYIEECLNSILNQTIVKDIEIIAVNDGSKDNSLNILKRISEKHDNVKVISQENQGAISARIKGYEKATGNYIGFVDNDDFIERDMYEKLYNKAITNDADIVICNYKFYPKKPKNKNKWFREFKGKVDYEFVNENNLLWNKIVRKEYLERIGIKDLLEKVGESAYTLALIQTSKIATINEELYNYRIRQQSLSSDFKNVKWHENGVKNAINRFEIIKGTELEKEWSNFFQYSIFYSMFKMLLVSACNSNKELYKKYKNEIKKYRNNEYFKKRFRKNYGSLKTFVVYNIIFKNYYLTKAATKIL